MANRIHPSELYQAYESFNLVLHEQLNAIHVELTSFGDELAATEIDLVLQEQLKVMVVKMRLLELGALVLQEQLKVMDARMTRLEAEHAAVIASSE